MERFIYKLCQVLPRDPAQKMGRPPRDVLMSWEDLSGEELEQLRKLQEPRLRPGQIAELDGKIVARGPELEEEKEPSQVDNADQGDGDDVDLAATGSADPVIVTKHATRMLWDVYRQHAAASAELREQTNEMNQRAIAQAKQLDEALRGIQNKQPGPPLGITMEDLGNVVRMGMGAFREVMNAKDEPAK